MREINIQEVFKDLCSVTAPIPKPVSAGSVIRYKLDLAGELIEARTELLERSVDDPGAAAWQRLNAMSGIEMLIAIGRLANNGYLTFHWPGMGK